TFYPIQRYLTPPAILALVALAAALLVPWVSRRLWWPGSDARAADLAADQPVRLPG
ncbi:MAG: hypothetical protein H0U40_05140, partial [Chloroflexia bacterium]|nr:hypothetical protein [Chloroflexia bacterium]